MKLFCKLPFSRISIDDDGNVWPACCPEWVAFPLGNVFKQTWEEIWMGENATKLRDSSFDGSLRYCKHDWCPNIMDAKSGIENYHVVPLEQAPKNWNGAPPIHVNMNYDQTCNLKCPSCRIDYIKLSGQQLDRVQRLHQYVEQNILPYAESIALTGVGDPFMSSVFRKFLMEFDTKKYPNIKTVHLHTNGQLFDEKTYLQMKGLHDIQLSTDISIDAASADVYAKVRPPGQWDKLMKNLRFIKRLDNLVLLGISMVVQRQNLHQLTEFVELGESVQVGIRETFVEFKRLRKAWHMSEQMYRELSIEAASSQKQSEFKRQLKIVERKRLSNAKILGRVDIRHNLQHYTADISMNVIDKEIIRASRKIGEFRQKYFL